MLVVRDTRQHVFGAFTAEPWRIAPRYYGTGESFVFQLQVSTHCLVEGSFPLLRGVAASASCARLLASQGRSKCLQDCAGCAPSISARYCANAGAAKFLLVLLCCAPACHAWSRSSKQPTCAQPIYDCFSWPVDVLMQLDW